MKCKICGNKSEFVFSAQLLQKYNVKYFCCPQCGFLQTEDPYWLEETYTSSINITDIGVLSRNFNLSRITTLIICFLFDKNAKFLDFAGGYGIFTRLMRDIGFDFYWYDKYSENLLARGFEYDPKIGKVELITCFEAFEHFENPIKEIEFMLGISKNILFTTELYGEKPPNPEQWWYYGLNHGQHISFYNLKTLQFIADKYNLTLCSNSRSIHLFTEKKLSNLYFQFILKLKHLGVDIVLKKFFLKSKTMDDFLKLKKVTKDSVKRS